MAKKTPKRARLKTWDRPFLAPGGGKPDLFYVVYGETDLSVPLSRKVYRSEGFPPGVQASAYGPEMPGKLREGYLWDRFVQAEPKVAAQAAACTHCVIVRGSPEDDTTLNYLRDLVGVFTYMLDRGACAIFDPWMFMWWTPITWRRDIFQREVHPLRHTVTLVSHEKRQKTKWFHTRGLRKFGRPDISVRHVGPKYEQAVADLCARYIEYQALGGVIVEGEHVRMRSLPPGGVAHLGGDLDDPDFNNVHAEIVWPKPGLKG